jgi:hypothetical protein
MRALKAACGAILLLLLASCVAKPTEANIGPYPNDYKELVKASVISEYYDPHSMRDVGISSPVTGYIYLQTGYVVCFRANAKNRLGAYTGLQQHAYLIVKEQVVMQDTGSLLCDRREIHWESWPEMEDQ